MAPTVYKRWRGRLLSAVSSLPDMLDSQLGEYSGARRFPPSLKLVLQAKTQLPLRLLSSATDREEVSGP